MKISRERITELSDNEVFVFGSNLEGRHGAGAAKLAKDKFGAIYGQAEGMQGQSYAIPTKNLRTNKALPIAQVYQSIQRFLLFATQHPELEFLVTKIGCGLAGFSDHAIARCFVGGNRIPNNVALPQSFVEIIQRESAMLGAAHLDLLD